uniref:Putative insulin-like peptide 2 n=1 Tax=Corethrella appendiculata TaxID=1370023 RepID=U5ERR0_9DIPT
MRSTNLFNLRLIIVYLGITTLISVAMSDPNSTEVFRRFTRKRYCGKHLTETLAFLCSGRYGQMHGSVPSKKSDDYEYYADQPQPIDDIQFQVEPLPKYLQNQLPPGFPFRSRMANAMIPRTFRRVRRQGVYDECCKKSCSLPELESYCDRS